MKQKKLGLFSAVAINVGLIVATSCLVSLGTGMGSIGRWFIIPLFLVVILNSFQMTTMELLPPALFLSGERR